MIFVKYLYRNELRSLTSVFVSSLLMTIEKKICSRAHDAKMTIKRTRSPSTCLVAMSMRRLLTHTLTIDTVTENVLTSPTAQMLSLYPLDASHSQRNM